MIRLLIFIIAAFFFSCRDKDIVPRPRAYPRVDYPAKEYKSFISPECPFTFEIPVYADTIDKQGVCWFDLSIKNFKAKLHFSYHPVSSRLEYDDFVKDAYDIADRINSRANYMEDTPVRNQNGVSGVIFEWSGPAASQVHFFMTDTTQHFFKAALYFDAKVQPDSLAPIADFLKEDIQHLISTFRWNR